MAVGQNLRYLFGVGYPPKVVDFKGFWDVHRGTGVLTHCHIIIIYSDSDKVSCAMILGSHFYIHVTHGGGAVA